MYRYSFLMAKKTKNQRDRMQNLSQKKVISFRDKINKLKKLL